MLIYSGIKCENKNVFSLCFLYEDESCKKEIKIPIDFATYKRIDLYLGRYLHIDPTIEVIKENVEEDDLEL